MAYKKALRGLVPVLQRLTLQVVLPRLPLLVAQAPRPRADDLNLDLEDAEEELEDRFGDAFDADDAARAAATALAKSQAAQAKAQMERVARIRPELAEPWLQPKIDHFVAQNAKLVTRVSHDFAQNLGTTISAGVRQGLRAEDIAAQVQDRFVADEGLDVQRAASRARLIARDQVSKFFGELTMTRQTALGVKRYTWRTAHDERVRASHAERDGEVFAWGEPMDEQLAEKGLEVDDIDGPPGAAILCRCTAEMVLDDLLDDSDTGDDDEADESADIDSEDL